MRYLTLLKEWFPLGLATVYVLGFVVVGFHLAGYGASSLDLIKAQYLAAGFWFCSAYLVYFGLQTLFRSVFGGLRERVRRPGFRQSDGLGNLLFSLGLNTGMLLSGGLAVLLVRLFPPPWGTGREMATAVSHAALWSVPFVVSIALLDVFIQLRDWFKKKAEAEDEPQRNETWMMAWATVTICALAIFLFSVKWFAVSIYRLIPFSFGGGQPRQVVFWLGAGTGAADSFLERDGTKSYSVPYDLLVESETALAVISPKDGQRAIEFDRKAVGAVVVLGKRPRTAPARF